MSVYSITRPFYRVEWKIPRPNKSDAVYICVGTGVFSPTGSEASAAAPKTGRLLVLWVKQSKASKRQDSGGRLFVGARMHSDLREPVANNITYYLVHRKQNARIGKPR
jgi:hypothetical protein